MLLISLAENKDVINVDIDIDSKLVPKVVVHDLLKGSLGIAVILLHDTSPMGTTWCHKCGVLLMAGVDPDVIVPITKVHGQSAGVPGNGMNDSRLIRDVKWLPNSIAISGH